MGQLSLVQRSLWRHAIGGGQSSLYHPTGNSIYTDSPVTPFVFEGAYVSGFNDPINFPYAPKTISFSMYRMGTLVGQSAWFRPSATSTFVASGYAGEVDLVIMGGTTAFAVMDDFQFHFVTPSSGSGTPPVTPVPEPETYAMMLAGLGLMGFMARRRKQKQSAAA